MTDARDMELSGPEVKLWRAVLLQAIEDATFRYKPKKRKKKMTPEEWERVTAARAEARRNAKREQTTARDWLLGFSRDFRLVCSLAGVDPEAVHDRAKKLARQGWEIPFRTTESQRQLVLETPCGGE
jgi:hypothetical protein